MGLRHRLVVVRMSSKSERTSTAIALPPEIPSIPETDEDA